MRRSIPPLHSITRRSDLLTCQLQAPLRKLIRICSFTRTQKQRRTGENTPIATTSSAAASASSLHAQSIEHLLKSKHSIAPAAVDQQLHSSASDSSFDWASPADADAPLSLNQKAETTAQTEVESAPVASNSSLPDCVEAAKSFESELNALWSTSDESKASVPAIEQVADQQSETQQKPRTPQIESEPTAATTAAIDPAMAPRKKTPVASAAASGQPSVPLKRKRRTKAQIASDALAATASDLDDDAIMSSAEASADEAESSHALKSTVAQNESSAANAAASPKRKPKRRSKAQIAKDAIGAAAIAAASDADDATMSSAEASADEAAEPQSKQQQATNGIPKRKRRSKAQIAKDTALAAASASDDDANTDAPTTSEAAAQPAPKKPRKAATKTTPKTEPILNSPGRSPSLSNEAQSLASLSPQRAAASSKGFHSQAVAADDQASASEVDVQPVLAKKTRKTSAKTKSNSESEPQSSDAESEEASNGKSKKKSTPGTSAASAKKKPKSKAAAAKKPKPASAAAKRPDYPSVLPPLPAGQSRQFSRTVPGGISICSWNVAGLRSACKKGFEAYVKRHFDSLDLICLSEVRCDPESEKQLTMDLPDYEAHFNHCSSKAGYSGVALLIKKSKLQPLSITCGMNGDAVHDSEGRVITVVFESFVVVCAYVPNSGDKLARLPYRTQEWDQALANYIQQLSAQHPSKCIVLTGDLNVARRDCDVYDWPSKKKKSACFTPEERHNMDQLLLKDSGLIDCYTELHPDHTSDSWSFFGFRANGRVNKSGWRLDYFLMSDSQRHRLIDCIVSDERQPQPEDGTALVGSDRTSDHLPIWLHLAPAEYKPEQSDPQPKHEKKSQTS